MTLQSKDLERGKFYWVLVDDSRQAGQEWQPARFTGRSGDGDARLTWDFVGLRSEDGHHFAEVIKIDSECSI